MATKETPKSELAIIVCMMVMIVMTLGVAFFFTSKLTGQTDSKNAAFSSDAQAVIDAHKSLQCRLCGKTMQPGFIEAKRASVWQAGNTNSWTVIDGAGSAVVSFRCPGCGLVENFSSLK